MKQHVRRLTWILGALTVAGASALAVVACNTDNGATPLPSADTNKSDTGTGGGEEEDDAEAPQDDGGTTEAGCTKEIPKLRSSVGPYCYGGAPPRDGGSDAGDGGPGPGNCADPNQVCCNGGLKPNDAGFEESTCKASVAECETFFQGSASTDNTIWECSEAEHCGGGSKCCLLAGKEGTPRVGSNRDYPGCDVGYVTANPKFQGGTRCQASCKTGEIALCAKNSDCPDGETCIPATVANRYTGVCQRR